MMIILKNILSVTKVNEKYQHSHLYLFIHIYIYIKPSNNGMIDKYNIHIFPDSPYMEPSGSSISVIHHMKTYKNINKNNEKCFKMFSN